MLIGSIARCAAALAAAGLLCAAGDARAIPAFARKYGTSCLTCHTVYPKLTPFGEAFRRNGYLFPGIDSDYVKQDTVVLSQEANKKTFPDSVWPGTIPISVPIAIGANGQALIAPSSTSTAARPARPGAPTTQFTLQDLVAEGHIWGGAALGDTITIWAEITFADGGAEVEHAQVLFNQLLSFTGQKHIANLVVGHGFPNLTPFGPHSSYLADQMVPNVQVGQLLGGGSAWQLVDNYTGVELNGVVGGRVEYAVGLNSGANSAFRHPTEDYYGQLGFKLGGLRLDGEGSSGPQDPLHPWAETALTIYGFGYRSNTLLDTTATPAPPSGNDVATTWGVGARAQAGSTELNVGWYRDRHSHATDAATSATARVFFGELSYVLFPWLVPSVRVEHIALDIDGAPSVNAWHAMPGIAFLIRPNLKFVAVANWERANGFPSSVATGAPTAWSGGSADWGSFTIAPRNGDTATTSSSEFETIAFFLAWAM
jgi:hypothetical protein